MSVTSPYSFVKRGNLFIIPVGPSIAEVPYPTYTITKPKDFSILVRGKLEEPEFQLDRARMPPSLYQDVRDDLVSFSPVPVSRSAFRRSQHAYVGVIDSKGTPYYFALDSHGISVREVPTNDDRVWKTFDLLADEEHAMALNQRRATATEEMQEVDRELSEPILVVAQPLQKSGGLIWHLLTHRNPAPKAPPRGAKPKALKAPKEKKEKEAKPKAQKPMRDLNFRTSESGNHHRATASHGKYKISTNSGYRHELTYQRHLHEKVSLGHFKTAQEAATRAHAHHAETHAALHKADRIRGGRADDRKPSDFDSGQLAVGTKHEREHTDDDAVAREIAMDHLAEDSDYYRKLKKIEKALPKKPKEEKAKKTKSSGASKKQTGAGGKTRYTYPGEKGGAKKFGAGKPGAQPILVIEHDDSKNADPQEFANQLGVSVRTLQRAAKHLGREGFSKFMRARLKRFSAKHAIDSDYWGTMYERLQTSPSLSASSEDE